MTAGSPARCATLPYSAISCAAATCGYVPLFVWRDQISIIVLRGWVRVGHPRGRVNEGVGNVAFKIGTLLDPGGYSVSSFSVKW